MGFPQRKAEILKALEQSPSLDIHKLSKQLGASLITIRRDLQALSGQGLLIRTHGGAMKPEPGLPFVAFEDKNAVSAKKKKYIGARAASFVSEGDIIFLDCGSTVFAMCEHLRKIPRLRIITNSLPIIAAFMDVESISVNLVGGEIDKARKAVHGHKAEQHIDSYHATKAFIGVDGVSATGGLTAISEKEASIGKAMARNADKVYLLCDSSKIGRDSYVKFAPLSIFDYLVTDKDLSGQQAKKLKAKNVQIIK